FFDHADLYGGGKSEEVFAKAIGMNDDVRENIILQSKCGICPGKVMFDFSKEHIIESTEGCLKRLKTDYLDFLLLHRPDTLYEPEEVAEAFALLKESGKVKHFGVSNQNPMQIRLLQKYLGEEPICADQLQFSITDCHIVKQGLYVNMREDNAIDRDGGILEFCRYEDITIQAWSPFQYGFFEGVYVDNPDFPEINAKLQELADKYGVTKNTIVMAWILRHPAKMQPLTGTMNSNRLLECAAAADITITKQEWYEIFSSAGNVIP
ncbi:MAG: aldo/keto reductase, partial [Clostridia bacterium]|nr:aldo/keto reductase [Clostridia bacterium]